jgi:diguanylate cyclase (GGDEF)-like protein/PAS domain S-box-containing protein
VCAAHDPCRRPWPTLRTGFSEANVNQSAFLLGALAGFVCAAIALAGTLRLWRMRLRRRAAQSDDWIPKAFSQWPTTALIVDPDSGGIIAANPAGLKSLGYSQSQLRTYPFTELFRSEACDSAELIERLRGATSGAPLEMRQHCQDGTVRNVEATCQALSLGERQVLAVAVHDISGRRAAETQLLERHQKLDHLANHDPLTGLPNRLYLAAHLPLAIQRAQQDGSVLAVLFLDLDRFKHINDSRGHETGDKLLKTVAQRLRSAMRADDLVVRMGGDEFVVVMRGVKSTDEVRDAAERIVTALGAPMVVDGRTLVSTASIGVALYPGDGADMGELLRHSDTAMYQAKDRGRNNFQLFSPNMDRRLKERIAIESSLRTALSTRQLEVHYQPIVRIDTQKVVAFEALLRWKHPSYGYVRPERFVTVAEEAGLIVPIGEFVLQKVVDDMVKWRAATGHLVPVAINVSAVQLQRCNLAESIERLTKSHSLEPSMLQIELTESAVFERREGRAADANQDALARLRELGVHIAIDDFGTGYSSLSYLKSWRVDTLKIDRSFIRDLVTDPSDLAIVAAIIAMATHLHIEVVAEGIEGFQQLEKLRQLGCHYAQGYLFARPLAASDCGQFLTGEPLNLSQRSSSGEITTTGEQVALRA